MFFENENILFSKDKKQIYSQVKKNIFLLIKCRVNKNVMVLFRNAKLTLTVSLDLELNKSCLVLV